MSLSVTALFGSSTGLTVWFPALLWCFRMDMASEEPSHVRFLKAAQAGHIKPSWEDYFSSWAGIITGETQEWNRDAEPNFTVGEWTLKNSKGSDCEP